MTNELKTWRQIATNEMPIIAPILAAAGYEQDEIAGVGTFCVNPSTLVITYNPKFAANNTPEGNAAILCHEALHVLCDHGKRQQAAMIHYGSNFQPHIWMVAEEMAVNAIVTALCKLPLPEPYVACENWALNMAVEEIYLGLLQRAIMIKVKCACLPKDGGEKQTGGATLILQQALSHAQRELQNRPGNMPGELLRIVTGLTAPKAPPKFADLLRRFLVSAQFSCKEFDPSILYRRRILMDGLCMPNLALTPGADRFVVSLDASGSVADEQFSLFAGTVDVVARQLGFLSMVVQQFTTQIMHTETVTNMQQISKIARQGSGGTCIIDADAKAKKSGGRFHIILTDGYVGWLDRYSIPTLVVVNGDAELPAVGPKGLIGAVKLT